MSRIEVLESELRKFEIDLPPVQKQLLLRYCDEVLRWNKKINLTGLSGPDMVRRLVIEPLWIGFQLKAEGTLADIGSGNGSPAVPLHIACNFRKVHLIEVRAKRAAFLRHLTTTLPLINVVIHRARFQDVISEIGPADWFTLQGIALSTGLLDSVKQVASATTSIVWISSPGVRVPLNPTQTITVPNTATQVYVFRGLVEL